MTESRGPEAAALKRDLRVAARARRERRSTEDRAALALALAAEAEAEPLRSASSVAAFIGVGSEPDTLPLVTELYRRGVRVLLPVVLSDLDLEWAAYAGEAQLVAGPKGLREPDGPRLGRQAIATADVVLVPALAVDTDGRRLGQGGGCYDRALQRVPTGVPQLAVVFDDELVEALPEEPHDRRVTGRLGGRIRPTAPTSPTS
ncbi:MAG: 5-formyltetrahydrofolate cyclo-ligase [Actinomycetes bacterium]